MSYSQYPNQLDNSTTLPKATDNVTEVKAEVVNRIRSAVLAIEGELGVQPSGIFSTVKDRLDSLRGEVESLKTTLGTNPEGTFADVESRLDSLEADIVAGAGGGSGGGAPTADDKDLTPASTSGDGSATGITLSNQTFGTSYVSVFVNGLLVTLGNGVKSKDCYFSPDGGTTARAVSDIAKTDELIWNGTIAGYDLDSSDRVDLEYDV